MSEPETILVEAIAVTSGERQHDYGHAFDNHWRAAALFEVYLRETIGQRGRLTITPEDVCFLNILQKIARQINRPKRDNLVDIAGWARNVEMIEQERTRRLNDNGEWPRPSEHQETDR